MSETEKIIAKLKAQGVDFEQLLKDCRREAREAEERLFQNYGDECDKAKAEKRE